MHWCKVPIFFSWGEMLSEGLSGCAGHGSSNSRTISEKTCEIFVTLFQTLTTQIDTLLQWPRPL